MGDVLKSSFGGGKTTQKGTRTNFYEEGGSHYVILLF